MGALFIDESIESLINGIRMVGYNRGLWFSESLITQQLVKNARESSILPQSISTSPSQSLGRVITVGALQLDVMQRQVLYKQQAIPLSKLECDFLAYLVQRVNQVCSYDELLDAVWGYEKIGDPHLVQLVAHRVRQKLKQTVSYDDRVLIETVRGIGLCLSYRENSDTIN